MIRRARWSRADGQGGNDCQHLCRGLCRAVPAEQCTLRCCGLQLAAASGQPRPLQCGPLTSPPPRSQCPARPPQTLYCAPLMLCEVTAISGQNPSVLLRPPTGIHCPRFAMCCCCNISSAVRAWFSQVSTMCPDTCGAHSASAADFLVVDASRPLRSIRVLSTGSSDTWICAAVRAELLVHVLSGGLYLASRCRSAWSDATAVLTRFRRSELATSAQPCSSRCARKRCTLRHGRQHGGSHTPSATSCPVQTLTALSQEEKSRPAPSSLDGILAQQTRH